MLKVHEQVGKKDSTYLLKMEEQEILFKENIENNKIFVFKTFEMYSCHVLIST